MAIAEVIKFEGPQDALVWKFPIEDFNATSQLIVDETHEALLVVNGNAADLFTAGRRTLSVPNIPIARTLIEIPTGGNSPFPCKVFFINKVHAMDLLWGTQGPIALEDPLYDIFMHVMANGSMSVSVENSRKFMLKIVGFRDRFTPDDLIAKFRGIISSHVKDCISKIMINGMLSYFMMNAHLFELSGVIKERLDKVFEEYGVRIEFFNIETIEVPEADYKKVSEAKERRTSRLIEGYNEAVINARGDIAIAQANYDAMFAEQQKKKNLGDLLLSWAFADDSSQADVSVKRFSISFMKEAIAKGFEKFVES